MTLADSAHVLAFPLDCIGSGEPAIHMLKGFHHGEAATLRTFYATFHHEETSIHRTFTGAHWAFQNDGTFTFAPALEANVRTDLYPVAGTFVREVATLALQGTRQASFGSSASLDGFIFSDGAGLRLDVIYVVASGGAQKIARITQLLARRSPADVDVADADVAGLPVPSRFTITLSGTTDDQPFGPLPGTLTIRSRTSDDANPFQVTLETTTPDVTQGGIFWNSFTSRRSGQGESNCIITIDPVSGQVTLEAVSRTQMRAGLTWFARAQGDLLAGLSVGVTVHQGTLTFSVQGNQIVGNIYATGLSDVGQPCAYTAHFTGQRTLEDPAGAQRQPEAAPRADADVTDVAGTWATGEAAFGSILLQQRGRTCSGTYAGRGGGLLAGTMHGTRLDFTWETSAQEHTHGWGCGRVLPSGSTLAGLWGADADKTDGQPFIATRQHPPLLTNESPAFQDMQELRFAGQDLVLQGQCAQAVELLERALSMYQAAQHDTTTSMLALESHLISETMLLTYLVQCDFQLEAYDRLLEHLGRAVDVRQRLGPRAFPRRWLTHHVTELAQSLTSFATHLATLHANATTLHEHATHERPEIVQFLTILQTYLWDTHARLNAMSQMLAALAEAAEDLPDALPALLSLPDRLCEQRTRIAGDITAVIAHGQAVFQHYPELLQLQTALFAQCERMDHTTSDRVDLEAIAQCEARLHQELYHMSTLTPVEKAIFRGYTDLVALMRSIASALEIRRTHLLRMQVDRQTQTYADNFRAAAIQLATCLEQWRARLVTDRDKIAALGQGQSFFQKLLAFLLRDLNSRTEALVVAEMAKTRAFADLLAAQANLPNSIQLQESSLMFSPATAPPLTFDDILSLLKYR